MLDNFSVTNEFFQIAYKDELEENDRVYAFLSLGAIIDRCSFIQPLKIHGLLQPAEEIISRNIVT